MRISYTNTRLDSLAFSAYALPRSRVGILMASILVVIIVLANIAALPDEVTWWKSAIILVMNLVMWLAFGICLMGVLLVLQVYLVPHKMFFCAHTVTLGPDSVIEETTFNRNEVKWTGIYRVRRTKRHVLIYTSEQAAHVVPRRAFDDNAQWDQFYEYCRRIGVWGQACKLQFAHPHTLYLLSRCDGNAMWICAPVAEPATA